MKPSYLPRKLFLIVLLLASFSAFAQNPTPVIEVNNPPNTTAQLDKHYVVLVSLDGFRFDYPQKYSAPHLLAIGAKGASAPNGMLPSFPSLTFPNHYTIITGLYPEHHGIVGNEFWDPVRNETYFYTDSKKNSDGTWYGGTPLWVLAEQQGMRSACFFWPASEAEIQGKRPSYYLHFDKTLNDNKRIDQVIVWLKLPPAQRPHFITLYYSDVDHAGHDFGPASDEVKTAVHHVDDLIGELETKLAALNLPIDLVVVADHGMAALQGDWVNLDQYADLGHFHTEGVLLYPKTDADAAKAYGQLATAVNSRKATTFKVYRRADVPAYLHFNSNPREGDPVIVPTGPFSIRAHPNPEHPQELRPRTVGNHGYDPYAMPQMRAIFFAEGPDIKPGVKLNPFENVNIYPLLAHILGLTPPPVDGKLEVLAPILATP